MHPKKVVVIGPESAGKTTLCSMLAGHFKTAWVPEYAREFLLKNGTDYNLADLYTIAQGQLQGEENIAAVNTDKPVLFMDTDMYVMKVWAEFVFNSCDNRVLKQIAIRKYDLYLLCNVDAPWVKDELREYPDLVVREKLYHHYKDCMVNQSMPWEDIHGNYEERFEKAVAAVARIL